MVEILRGKISLLDDQLAKLGDSSAQEKGEVMGDVLKVRLGLQGAAGGAGKAVCGRAGCPLLLGGCCGAERSVGAPFVPNLGIQLPGSYWSPSMGQLLHGEKRHLVAGGGTVQG